MPRPLLAVAALAAVAILGACDQGSRQDRFCKRLADDRALLATVPADPADLDAFVDRYRDLGDVAPLAIEDQWTTIADLFSAVATVDLADPAATDRLRDQAVAATRAVDEVRVYAKATCDVDLVLASVPATPPPTAPADPGVTTVAPGVTPPPTLGGTTPPTVP